MKVSFREIIALDIGTVATLTGFALADYATRHARPAHGLLAISVFLATGLVVGLLPAWMAAVAIRRWKALASTPTQAIVGSFVAAFLLVWTALHFLLGPGVAWAPVRWLATLLVAMACAGLSAVVTHDAKVAGLTASASFAAAFLASFPLVAGDDGPFLLVLGFLAVSFLAGALAYERLGKASA